MKIFIQFLFVVVIAILISCTNKKDFELSYRSFDHYFVKNSYHIDSIGSFLEIHDTTLFNKVFSPAFTMDKITWIVPYYYKDNFVIAVIKDCGNNNFNLKISKISLIQNETIKVDYDYNLIEKNISYRTTKNSIIMVNNRFYNKIQFYENGKYISQISK